MFLRVSIVGGVRVFRKGAWYRGGDLAADHRVPETGLRPRGGRKTVGKDCGSQSTCFCASVWDGHSIVFGVLGTAEPGGDLAADHTVPERS